MPDRIWMSWYNNVRPKSILSQRDSKCVLSNLAFLNGDVSSKCRDSIFRSIPAPERSLCLLVRSLMIKFACQRNEVKMVLVVLTTNRDVKNGAQVIYIYIYIYTAIAHIKKTK